MAIDLKDQTFGVEIEFTGISRERAAEVIADYFDTFHSSSDGSCYDTRKIIDSQGRKWQIMRDSSISPERRNPSEHYSIDDYRCEFVTPILKSDEDMRDLQQLVRNLRQAGMKVNSSCGLHVHIGAERQDAKSLTRLSNIMYQKEDILFHALKVPESRAMRWCKKTDEEYIRRLNAKKPTTKDQLADIWYGSTDNYNSRFSHYNSSRYRALNLHAYFTKGTVEFRCFNSTTNAGKVRTYVRFAQAVTAQALNQRSASVHKTHSSNECYTFRTWLIRIGLNGDEFKVPRQYLLSNLEGRKDWKDKAAAMERRRLRAQEARSIAESVQQLQSNSNNPREITIRNIINTPDREERMDNTLSLRERIVMLLESVRTDESITAEERISIFNVLGINPDEQNLSVHINRNSEQTINPSPDQQREHPTNRRNLSRNRSR